MAPCKIRRPVRRHGMIYSSSSNTSSIVKTGLRQPDRRRVYHRTLGTRILAFRDERSIRESCLSYLSLAASGTLRNAKFGTCFSTVSCSISAWEMIAVHVDHGLF